MSSADFVGRLLTDTRLPMVGIQDTETHLRRRKNWTRGMGAAAIREYEPFIAERARQLVDRLEEQKGAVTIGNWFNYFSYVRPILVVTVDPGQMLTRRTDTTS